MPLLNSGFWTDRNKGEFVIQKLIQKDPALVHELRDTASQALAEMACWDDSHAYGARFLLTRVTGLSSERIDQLSRAGDIDGIVAAAKSQNASVLGAPLEPSLHERGAILTSIFETDQSDNTRSHAPELYRRLLELRATFVGTKLEGEYHNSLSLESFHSGQTQALTGKSNAAAIDFFRKSLSHAGDAVKARGASASDDEWTNYVAATLAYMKGDNKELLARHGKMRNGTDRELVGRLVEGLQKFGAPDYVRDCSNKSAAN